MSYEDGWSGYPDERMGGLGDMAMAGLNYSPSFSDVGHGSAYWPGDVSADAAALNYIGFLPDVYAAQLNPSTGSQQGDMNGAAGAWDPNFRQAVTDFQDSAGLTADGWIGPNTRRALAVAVQAKNASDSPIAPPYIPPPVAPAPGIPNVIPNITPPQPAGPPVLPLPAVPGASPAQPASAHGETDWALYGGIAAGGAVLLGLAWWALKD